MKLFCIAHAGGDVRIFSGLAKQLSKNIDLIALERPGRGKRVREVLLQNMDAMVEDLVKQVSSHFEEPYAVYGHSMGARLGYLICRRFLAEGRTLPRHLFVSGCRAPSLTVTEKDTWKLSSEDFWAHLRNMGGCPEELFSYPLLMNLFEPILRADFKALSTFVYEPQQPMPLPISVMIGDREAVSAADAKQWQQESTFPITLKIFPGNHFFINQHWPVVADFIKSSLIVP